MVPLPPSDLFPAAVERSQDQGAWMPAFVGQLQFCRFGICQMLFSDACWFCRLEVLKYLEKTSSEHLFPSSPPFSPRRVLDILLDHTLHTVKAARTPRTPLARPFPQAHRPRRGLTLALLVRPSSSGRLANHLLRITTSVQHNLQHGPGPELGPRPPTNPRY